MAPSAASDREHPAEQADRTVQPDGARARRGRTFSVRTRVLASVLVMTALGMLVSVTTLHVVRARELDVAVDAAIRQEVQEFRALATQGVDPETGRPFTSVEQLLRVGLQRNVPGQYETFLTLLGGEPLQVNGGERPIRLEEEPAVLAAATSVGPGSPVSTREVRTAQGRVRLGIVPVGGTDSEVTGTYVIGVAVDLEREQLLALTRTHALVAVASLLLVAVVGWVVATRLLRPLTSLREATRRISEQDLTQRIPERGGSDDVSELTRTYNAMLDRLENAFVTQRQFIDDAGHELRTPVTILRGHLELLDAGDPDEVAETRTLLLDELDRMSLLVEDLILLAKARRPDFVQPRVVGLGSFTSEVADKARGLGDRAWRAEPGPDVDAAFDPQRVTQAVLQLAQNAVKYSEPGTEVTVGSEVADGQVRLWVRDAGHGIHPADLERIFERFGRAETGRGVEGSGLGLAIVAAIAEAHGGCVEVQSRLGFGSMFTIVLPHTAPAGPAHDEDDEPTELEA